MRKKFTILAFAVSMLTAGNLFAQDYYEHIKTMNIYSTDEFIEIDGVANESCWSAAEVTENAIDVINKRHLDNLFSFRCFRQSF